MVAPVWRVEPGSPTPFPAGVGDDQQALAVEGDLGRVGQLQIVDQFAIFDAAGRRILKVISGAGATPL